MDAGHLAFADASFDAAVAMFVITVVPEPQRVLSEMVRVVRPGGRVVVVSHFRSRRPASSLRSSAGLPASRPARLESGFPVERILGRPDLALVERRSLGASGFHTLLVFERM